MHHYLEFVGGNSAKFWEVSVKGSGCTVRFGRIGTQGQAKNTGFANHEAALKHAQKQLAQKVAKGYAETTTC